MGIIWLLSFPYIARNVFTSENALSAESYDPKFGEDSTAYGYYKQTMEKIKRDDKSQLKNTILERLGAHTEVYLQDVQLKNS